MAPRELAPVLEAGKVVGWICRSCNWTLPVQTPRPLGDYGEYPLNVVQKVFDAHSCETYDDQSVVDDIA